MFRVIIAGGRDFDNYELLKEKCSSILDKKADVEIVSGTAGGADELGEKLAIEKGLGLKSFPAPWTHLKNKPDSAIGTKRDGTKYWKAAGHYRNKKMAEYSDALIVFWDGKSKGTANMIKVAEHKNIPVRKIMYSI
jgi:hypothetical protein